MGDIDDVVYTCTHILGGRFLLLDEDSIPWIFDHVD
jgi:hypothetical protein